VLYYCRSFKHIEALWFANVGNQVLWWTYVKACWRAAGSACAGKGITFKTTMKVGLRRFTSLFSCFTAARSMEVSSMGPRQMSGSKSVLALSSASSSI